MWLQLSRLAVQVILLVVSLCLGKVYAATWQAFPSGQPLNRVLAVVEDKSTSSIILSTSKRQVLPVPNIQFWSGSNGQAVMAADFGNINIDGFPVTIFSAGQGIEQLHFKQLQVDPPILRISLVASNPAYLRQVAFTCQPGRLLIKLPSDNNNEPPLAPDKNIVREQPLKAPPILGLPAQGPAGKEVAQTVPPLAPENKFVPLLKKNTNLPTTASNKQIATAQISHPNTQVFDDACITLTLSKSANLEVKLTGQKSLSAKTFRLHAPERYVIDLANLPVNTRVAVPDLEPNAWLAGVRVGSLDQENQERITRIVLDLNSPTITTRDLLNNEGNVLSIFLDDKTMLSPPAFLNRNYSIVLDAGHGGLDPGARRGDVQEKDITLAIVNKLQKQLEAKGLKITLTRFDDTYVSLEDRVKKTNILTPDVFLSVHINSLEADSTISGIETYYQTEQSKSLAKIVHESLVKKLAVPDRLVRKARFYVINHTPAPAVLAEVGFMSNKEERDKLVSSDYQSAIAVALADAVIVYLANRQEPATAEISKRLNPATIVANRQGVK